MAKRFAKREEATKASEEAKEIGTAEEVDKFSRRTVRVTKEHNEECKKLLRLMGVPHVDAPCEAEAQCAALAKAGKVPTPLLLPLTSLYQRGSREWFVSDGTDVW